MKLLTLLLALLVTWKIYHLPPPQTHDLLPFSAVTTGKVTMGGDPIRNFSFPCPKSPGSRRYEIVGRGIQCWDAEKQKFIQYELEEQ